MTAQNGVYDLEGVGLKGNPGSNVTIYMNSLSIDRDKVMKITGLPYSDLKLALTIKDCEVGEILTDNM
jgi:hypothetical protein